jgi:hypothetical protein
MTRRVGTAAVGRRGCRSRSGEFMDMTTCLGASNGGGAAPARWHALYHACLAGLLLALGALLVWRPLYGALDFWALAGVGRWTWQTGHVPHRTLFLWTADEPWVYHHWLAALVFYGLTNVGGPRHLPAVVLAFTAVLVLLPFGLVWLVWRRHGRLTSWMVVPFALALKGLAPRFEARPELFTELSLCLLLWFLVTWAGPGRGDRGGGRDRLRLVAVLFLFTVWANLHGGVVIGLLVLALTAGCDLAQQRLAPRARVLGLLALLAFGAVCVNPYGVSYWQALRPVGSYTFSHILEWLPVWRGPPLPLEWAAAAVVLGALALGAWIMNPNRRWAYLAWLLLLGGLFVLARRNVWPFFLTCLMVLAANAQGLDAQSLWQKLSRFSRRHSREQPQAMPALLGRPARGALLGWLVLECLLAGLTLPPSRALLPTWLDRGVVHFIQEHRLEGRMFNDYYNSSYLQWRLAGRPALYIDSLNAYPDQVAQDYDAVVSLTERGRRLLRDQQIEVVVLTIEPASIPVLAPLADALDADSRWVRVYANADGVIWVRSTPEYEPIWGPACGPVNHAPFALLNRWAGAAPGPPGGAAHSGFGPAAGTSGPGR